MSMTVPERLVLLAAEVRALREEGIESRLILDDVESMLKKIISLLPDAPTIGQVIDRQLTEAGLGGLSIMEAAAVETIAKGQDDGA